MTRLVWICPLLGALMACASKTPGSTTPARHEVIVDEALVVNVVRRDEHGLPPLPRPLSATSEAFRRAHGLALPLLTAAGPELSSAGDELAYQDWTRGPFTEWMETRGEQTRATVAELGAVKDGPANEHVVAAALVGLIYWRLTEQLVAIPAPAHLTTGSLLEHYRKGLDQVSAEWRKAAERSFFHCARYAAEQTDGAYRPWLELCHERLAALDVQRKQAKRRAAKLEAESEAARAEAADLAQRAAKLEAESEAAPPEAAQPAPVEPASTPAAQSP